MTLLRGIWIGLWTAGGTLLVLALAKPQWHGEFWADAGVVIMLVAGALIGAGCGLLALRLIFRRWL